MGTVAIVEQMWGNLAKEVGIMEGVDYTAAEMEMVAMKEAKETWVVKEEKMEEMEGVEDLLVQETVVELVMDGKEKEVVVETGMLSNEHAIHFLLQNDLDCYNCLLSLYYIHMIF